MPEGEGQSVGDKPPRTEYTTEELKLFTEFEKQLDVLVAPYLSASKDYGNFRVTARRFPKSNPRQEIFYTRWEYNWKDNNESTRIVVIRYDIEKRSFYLFSESGEQRLLPTVAEAINEIQAQLNKMAEYFKSKE